ncbi:fungal-specific transcription factor domain-containing protein [Mycena alexandri]|uniref:Fungal-specific transcription factor domain-containing protein n=1 Tax=Mycena alexandri TaxID=1745969 RepID=A0AAD6TDU4_9AGAR|nr:fungal-specific transcription factor domain-containing protein [Mycena alexandri]
MAMKEQYLGRSAASHARRQLFWDMPPWEKEVSDRRPHYIYPDGDLIASLLQLYFTHLHPTIPVLHRPSFEWSVTEGLYLTDPEFGGLLLSVLAIASWYSDDPRVFVKDDDTSLSAGWKIQMYFLLGLFGLGTSRPEISAVYMGLSISFLQLRGEYRQKREGKVRYEHELWRRVFWSCFLFDRMSCVFHGRPPGFDLDDDAVDLLLEVDDEYWDRGFVQPLGKPSTGSYLVHHAKLCKISGEAMRRLYVSKEMKIRLGWVAADWEHDTVAELDSAMKDFSDSIPAHLRWDPDGPTQGAFFNQSLTLHTSYHLIQIMIHRPYIHKMSALAAPSLSICTSSARTILHAASVWLKNQQRQPLPTLLNPVFVAGTIVVLNMFGNKRAGLSVDMSKDLAHMETAMEVTKSLESRFQPAGRLWELLRELQSLDPLPASYPVDGDPTSVNAASTGQGLPATEPFRFPGLSDGGRSPDLKPGVSIEQLLADTDPSRAMNGLFDDELMSMWMAAPANIA